jgi:hypothetical protein
MKPMSRYALLTCAEEKHLCIVKEVPTGERQEMSGRSKECSDVSYRRNAGWPTEGDLYGNGAAIRLRPCGIEVSASERGITGVT